jgi:hypothetical protein
MADLPVEDAPPRAIAKGNRIREVQRLVQRHGGKSSKWIKMSSPRFHAEDYQYEYRWYEHPGIGRVEIKCKRVS